MNIEIRKITEDDRDAFVKLSLEFTQFNQKRPISYYPDNEKMLEIRKARVEERFDKINQSSSKVIFMAFMEDIPVGYIRAFTYDQKLRRGCLDELYIAEKARKQGVGKKLLDAVTEWMGEKKVVRMIVSVYYGIRTRASFTKKKVFVSILLPTEKTFRPFEKSKSRSYDRVKFGNPCL